MLKSFRHRGIRTALEAAVLAACLLSPLPARATLILSTDGKTVYDTVNKISWLADSDLAATNRFGLLVCSDTTGTKACVNPSGSMSYQAAAAWVAAMNAANYLGHANWQLPTTPSSDSTCPFVGPNGNSFGFNCSGSAMGSLYYGALGLKAPNTAVPIPNMVVGPFSNFQPYLYWSGTVTGSSGNGSFSFASGFHGSNTTPNFLYVLPMIPGKISGTPAATGKGLQVNPDGQTVYDPVANVTWLANANLAATNTFGLPACTEPGPKPCVNPDGAMNANSASQFITNMNAGAGYLGQTKWELPPMDINCDASYNCASASDPFGQLFYGQLGLSPGASVVMAPNIAVGPLRHIQPYLYWGCQAPTIQDPCQADGPARGFEWSFSFGNGFEGTDVLANDLYVTAYYVESNVPPPAFVIANRGGALMTSSGTANSIAVGYGEIQPSSGSTTPSGIAIFDLRQNNILVSEVGVPATPALISGRIYAEIEGAVDAGLAIANPGSSPATISFYFTDANGNPAGSGSTTIAANQQIAQFLDQSPFKVYTTPAFQGTFTFTSSVPVAVVALRGFTNERGEFLMSTLPVIDTTIAPGTGIAVIPHFADGGGWTTQVLLVNPTDNPMAGTVQFANPAGTATNVTIGGQTNSSFAYSIPKRTSMKLATSGLTSAIASGSIRIAPTGGGTSPTPLVLFSYKPGGITVSEASVPVATGSAFRVYVEAAGVPGRTDNIESGIAVANTTAVPASVTFGITDLTGAPVSGIPPVTTTLTGSGQISKLLSDIFPSLPNSFQGVLRITTTSSGISVVGLRTRITERGDFLITTTPPTNENSTPGTASMYFPQVADGGGYTTQFALYSGTAGQITSGVLKFTRQDGSSFSITLN
nr:hypothetical protein Hi04_10k_c1170_00015 [uncultured bacterium]